MQRKYKKRGAASTQHTKESAGRNPKSDLYGSHWREFFFSSKVGQVAGPKGNIHLGSLAMYLPLLSPTSPDPLSLFSFIETRQNSRIPPHYYDDDDDRAAARGEFTFLFLFN